MKANPNNQVGFTPILVLLALGLAALLIIVIRSVSFATITNTPSLKSGPLGFFYSRLFSQADSTTPAIATSIEFASPKAGQSVQGLIGVAAIASIKGDIQKASAVLRIDGKGSRDSSLKKLADGKWILRTSLSTKKYPNGKHTLQLFIIDNSLNEAKEIGSSSIEIVVNN